LSPDESPTHGLFDSVAIAPSGLAMVSAAPALGAGVAEFGSVVSVPVHPLSAIAVTTEATISEDLILIAFSFSVLESRQLAGIS